MKNQSEISNGEWAVVIGFLAMVDLLQFVLDILAIGFFGVNDFIDIATGMGQTTYCWLRGINLNKGKIGVMGAAFIGELIPGIDALPLWSAEMIVIMFMYKAEKEAERLSSLNKENAVKTQVIEQKKVRDFEEYKAKQAQLLENEN